MRCDVPPLNLHAIVPRSRANGPGTRLVLWFQGCTLGCPGCFNPETHGREPRLLLPVDAVLQRIASEAPDIEGVSLSGGEPLQQPASLLALLAGVRERTGLSALLFSGYTLEEIRGMPLGPAILAHVDVLVAGRYVAAERLGRGLLGSANQHVHLLSARYALSDIEDTPPGEVRIEADGTVTFTGIAPPPPRP